MLSTANSNGKNTLENLSMFMARVRLLCARAGVAANAAAVACGGGRGGGGIGWPSFNFKLLCKPKDIFMKLFGSKINDRFLLSLYNYSYVKTRHYNIMIGINGYILPIHISHVGTFGRRAGE